MRTCILGCVATLLCLASLTTAFAQRPEAALKGDPDLALMRSLPGVYMVRFFGVGEVSVPSAIEIHLEGLDREFETAVASGKIPADTDRVEFKWQRLREEPQAYLKPSAEMLTAKQDVEAWGTAFAISREGILLTNRHVVENKPEPLDARTVDGYAPEPFARMADSLISGLGRLPSDPQTRFVTIVSLLDWFGRRSVQTGTYTRGEILLSFSKQKDDLTDATRLAVRRALRMFGQDAREAAVAPVTIVAKGGDRMHQDVAILRLDAEAADALVCLPLAGDDLARQEMLVVSLGFPDWRYDTETMHPLELLQVNESRGTIQLLPHSDKSSKLRDRLNARFREIRSGAEELMLISAKMWHGVSGGPVVTETGLVVGLNVSGNKIALPQSLPFHPKNLFTGREAVLVNNFAVPIAEARKLLEANRIVPNPGTTTQLWNQGLELYRLGRYAEASGKFREVAQRQKIGLAAAGAPRGTVRKPYEGPPPVSRNVVNQYVQEMLDLSLAKATVGDR
jgi:hypothetical protein